MTDEQFHEFHLDGKQMVFLFMASTVVAVVIFLCGVMVGRGVRGSKDLQAAQATASSSFAPLPEHNAPSDPTLVDEALPDPVVEPVSPERAEGAAESPDSARSPAETAPREPVPSPRPTPGAKPSPPGRNTTGTAAVGTAPPADGYVVQVMAVAKQTDANARVRKLVAKGYRSFVSVGSSGTARYRVRVGPFATLSEAQSAQRRLEREEKFRGTWIPPR